MLKLLSKCCWLDQMLESAGSSFPLAYFCSLRKGELFFVSIIASLYLLRIDLICELINES